VIGIHLNFLPVPPPNPEALTQMSEEERKTLEENVGTHPILFHYWLHSPRNGSGSMFRLNKHP
jgi:hypothetical protein